MPRRTLLFIHSSDPRDPIGGGEASLIALVTRLDPNRFRVLVALSGPGELQSRLEAKGIETRVVPMDPLYITISETHPLRLGRLLLKSIRSTVRCARLMQEEGVDLVCTNVQGGHLYGGLAALLTGKPMVQYMRDIPQGRFSTHLFPWIAYRLADRVICISQAVLDFFAGHPRYGSRIVEKAIVVHNGIDVQSVTPAAPCERLLEELALRDAYPIVTIIGRLQPWKGQREFVQAAATIRKEFPGARFLVVGEAFGFQSEYRSELESWVREHDLDDACIFTGQRPDVEEILSVTDIVVSASWHEPFGRVLVEAMAMARPVVGTNAGAAPEIIADGETGLLVPIQDPAALATAVVGLAQDRETAQRMGRSGRQRAETDFSLDATVRNATAVFEALGR